MIYAYDFCKKKKIECHQFRIQMRVSYGSIETKCDNHEDLERPSKDLLLAE